MSAESKVYLDLIRRMGGEEHVSESGRAMARAIAHWAALNELDESLVGLSLATLSRWLREMRLVSR